MVVGEGGDLERLGEVEDHSWDDKV